MTYFCALLRFSPDLPSHGDCVRSQPHIGGVDYLSLSFYFQRNFSLKFLPTFRSMYLDAPLINDLSFGSSFLLTKLIVSGSIQSLLFVFFLFTGIRGLRINRDRGIPIISKCSWPRWWSRWRTCSWSQSQVVRCTLYGNRGGAGQQGRGVFLTLRALV